MISKEELDDMVESRWGKIVRAKSLTQIEDIEIFTSCYFCSYDTCLLAKKLENKDCYDLVDFCVPDYIAFLCASNVADITSAHKHAQNILSAIVEIRNELYPERKSHDVS